jgi:O-antigen ligase
VTLLIPAIALAPVVIVVAVFCIRSPMRVALPIFAALIPFGGRLALGSSPYGSLSSLSGVLLGAGLVLQLVTTRRSAQRLSPTVPIWLLFLGAAIATGVWTIDLSATFSGIKVLGSLVIVYVLAALSHVDRSILRRTESALLLGGVAAVAYGLTELLFLGGLPVRSQVPGAATSGFGRFGDDMLGANIEAVALLLPLAIALNRTFNRAEGRTRRLGYGLCAALLLFGVLMTGSRGGTLAAGVTVLVLAFAGPRPARKPLLAFFALGIAVAATVWVLHPAGIATRSYASATSSSGRTDIWEVGLASCSRYCAVGAGWGTFPDVYAATQSSVAGARVLVGAQGTYQPHNLWLLAAIELGLPGLVLMACGLGASFIEAVRLPRMRRGPPMAALCGMLFAVFFLSSFQFKFFWMVLLMVTLSRNLVEVDPLPDNVALKDRPRVVPRSPVGQFTQAGLAD